MLPPLIRDTVAICPMIVAMGADGRRHDDGCRIVRGHYNVGRIMRRHYNMGRHYRVRRYYHVGRHYHVRRYYHGRHIRGAVADAVTMMRAPGAIELYRRKASPIALVSGTVQAPKSPIGWMEKIGDSTAAEEKQHRNYQKPSHLTELQVSHRNVAGACQSEGASWSRRDKPTEADAPL